jgi:hypothetical protein
VVGSRMTRRLVRWVGLVLLLTSTPAWAGAKEAAQGEHVRLSEEMGRLAGRGAWRGVDRAYRSMEPLVKKGVALTYDNHYQGAQASRELGSINNVFRRLLRAQALESTQDVENWLGDINANYGLVELVVPDRFKNEIKLSVAQMPLFPDQRTTIGQAQTQLAEERRTYTGLLPVGDYTFVDKTFKVVPGGETIRIELNTKGTRVSRREAGEKAPFRTTYFGPRADLGFAWTSATDAAKGGAQPGGFGGPGGRLGAGVEVGVGGQWGVLAQLGYHNLFGPPKDGTGRLEEKDEYAIKADSMHIGFGWLAATVRLGDVWLAAGPLYALGSGGVTGVNDLCRGQSQDSACSSVGTANSETLRYQRLQGKIRAGGGAISGSYTVVEFGRSMVGGVTLAMGTQSDMSRMYPWGTLSFTVAPQGPEGGE